MSEEYLIDAAEEGNLDRLQMLLQDHQLNINYKDKYGNAALHLACVNGHEAVAALVLDRGADIHAKNNFGYTALHRACIKSHVAVAALLLDRGTDKNATDNDGLTALHMVCMNDHSTVASLLLARGADFNAKNKDGKTALDIAKQRNLSAIVDLLISSMVKSTRDLITFTDLCQKDDLGNTPLLCAAENGHAEIISLLFPLSPWHVANNANRTFLDVVLGPSYNASKKLPADLVALIEYEARGALNDESKIPSHRWAAVKFFNRENCRPIDTLMDMIGIRSVKMKVLQLFQTVKSDIERPLSARLSNKQAMNFLFFGNPGTGKSTVARLIGDILTELGVRKKGSFVEMTGQELINEGSKKFSDLLTQFTPGVFFIDEIYQLDPKSNQDGRAITNAIIVASENYRDKLTFIVAGNEDDVRNQWLVSNPGLSSRFPNEVSFECFEEDNLRKVFFKIVREFQWTIENYIHPSDSTVVVDVALAAARRLARGASRKGFANARSVRILIEQTMQRASQRQKSIENACTLSLSKNHGTTLTLHDVLGKPIDVSSSPTVKKLLSMIGLDSVKDSVLGLLHMSFENYESELRGEPVIGISLHRMFLGNPGTGKTTIAEIYGRILAEMGYLSNGGVVAVGASQLTGAAVGETAKKVNELLDSVKGKVLIIDEAYVLARPNSSYGQEALDTLVERVQGIPDEDFAVILCGYQDEMMSMLDSNAGLSRRFQSENPFIFADYDNAQLITIMETKSHDMGLFVKPEIAKAAVENVLAKQRTKPNFGNVGAVNNLLDHAKGKMMKRPDRTKFKGRWIILEDDLFTKQDEGNALRALDNLKKMDHICNHIVMIQKQILVQNNKGALDPKKLLKNYLFVGPPGTGKTTVAKRLGFIFHSLGLLSSDSVIECKAMDLIAGYVGQSAGLVKAKMDKARGGVLFIDEAYGLNGTNSPYARDAVEMLLANMADPIYEGNMVIILAGYPDQIQALMQCNPGLSRRVTECLEFFSWEPSDCLDHLMHLSGLEQIETPHEVQDMILSNFNSLSKRAGWGNAGDVNNILDKMIFSRNSRCDDEGNVYGPFTQSDVDYSFSALFRQRPHATKLPDALRRQGLCL